MVALVGQRARPPAAREHVAELEERDVGEAVRGVERDRAQQPGQDAGRRIDSSARSGFSTSSPSRRAAARTASRSAGASNGSV